MGANGKAEKYRKIRDVKVETTQDVLCKGIPSEFAIYLNYCRCLDFEAHPDYAYLRKLFRDLFFRQGYQYDFAFDWTVLPLGPTQVPEESRLSPVALDEQAVRMEKDEQAVPACA